ncbi:MAG: outer rane secretion protein [Caulobacter sp.]|nr:outer rane secretion protein [Caulobacter sp.]
MSQVQGTGAADVPLNGGSGDDKMYGYGGADEIYGGQGTDSLYAGAGNDTLYGGEGNDFLDGGIGDDSMYGGVGNDVYVVDSASDVVVESANEGVDEVRAYISYTLGDNIENMRLLGNTGLTGVGNGLDNKMFGTVAGDTLSGLDGNDSISGDGGADNIYGGNGNDWMSGGDGNDVLIGGAGTDAYYGGAGDDNFNVEIAELKNNVHGGEGHDRVNLEDAASAVKGVVVNMAALEIEQISGTNFADTFDGSGVTYADAYGQYAVISGGGGADTITGSAFADVLNGDGGNDKLYGGAGNDGIWGGDGADTITGGAGNDTLFGGAGADTFIFAPGDLSAPDYNSDRIGDYEAGVDVLDLTAFGLASQGQISVTYVNYYGTDHAYVGIDTDNNGSADVFIDLQNVAAGALTPADFHI